jgi:hypothetical protein
LGKGAETAQVYEMTFEPDIPRDSRQVMRKVFKDNLAEINAKIGAAIQTGTQVFIFNQSVKVDTMVFAKSTTHKLTLTNVKSISLTNINEENKQQVTRVFNIIIKNYLLEMKMVEIGRLKKYFNLQQSNIMQFDEFFKLNVLMGFKITCDIYKGGVPLVMVDYCTRIMR